MSRLPETGPSLRRFLTQQKRQAGRAQNSSPFTRSGSGVTAVDEVTYEGVLKILGQMVVDGTLIVNGPLTVTQTADITGTTHVGGATTIDGSTTIDDTLSITGATDIDGTLNVDAATTIDGNTTIGGTLGVTGVTTLGAPTSVTGALNVSGPMAVTGTLSLPAGIIDNDALASPVVLGGGNADQANITLTTADANYAPVTVAVPSGFTRAGVLCIATWVSRYPSSGGGSLFLKPSIGGTTGLERGVFCAANAQVTLTASFYLFMTGLSGSFTAAATARRDPAAVPDPAGTNATTSVMAVFLR